jgi:hypothetical protein
MKKKKTNIAIVVLLILLLAIGIGYAAFGDTLTIDGSATMNGTFDVEFTDVADSGTNVTSTITEDTTVLSVAATLAFPGDGVSVTPTITNNGTVPAKVTAINVYAAGTTTPLSDVDVEVSIPALADDELASGEDCTFTFTIVWNGTSTLDTSKTVDFDIKIEYTQDTEAFTATPAHNDHV